MTTTSSPCCSFMGDQLTPCPEHGLHCPDYVVHRYDDSYGIPVPDTAGGGYYHIEYCPWCGKKLTA